jgi:signal transduction histidine kinase
MKKMNTITKRFFNDFNIAKQARELGVPVWQAPSFLFFLMGVIIIFAMTSVYMISRRYDSPEVLVSSEAALVVVLFTIGNFIINGIEQMARVNKMKSEFISIASHQLKTPLAEINWEIELLLSKNQQGLNEKQKELITRISSSNNRMARLVNDLLDVARIDQGKLALAREKFDIADLIEKVVENNRIIAQANNVEIKIGQPKKAILVLGDRRRVGVVFDNLISNAIKYIKKKGLVKVMIYQKGNSVIVSVKDNGIGIPKYQQDNVFEKFFRSDNVTSYQVSGTGLGLYIAKNIIEQSGGKIWFESEQEVGSEFFFSIPINSNNNNSGLGDLETSLPGVNKNYG